MSIGQFNPYFSVYFYFFIQIQRSFSKLMDHNLSSGSSHMYFSICIHPRPLTSPHEIIIKLLLSRNNHNL